MAVRNAVVGVPYRKGTKGVEFLILHRVMVWKGWEFPKGGVERSDATEETALIREMREETGLEGRVGARLPYQIKYKFPADNKKYTGTVQSVYLVRIFGGNITLTREHDRHKWLTYKAARRLLTHEQQKRALDIAWKMLNEKESGEVTF